MSLNGIDVASYQAGLDPAKVPCDFVIVKATQGTGYINPDFRRMADAVLAAGKLLGIYHYGAGKNPISEAEFFLNTIGPYIGKAVLALDWEKDQNPGFGHGDVDWCKKWLDHVKGKTGVRSFIYMSKDMGCRAHNWSAVSKDYLLWGAQYASNRLTGYQTNPWTDSGSWGSWPEVTIFQYSSKGRLSGWTDNLDIDIAYMDKADWEACSKGKPVAPKYPDRTDSELAVEVLFCKHGSDDARVKDLGNRYAGVQARVNKFLGNSALMLTAIQQYLKKYGCKDLI